MVECKVVEAPFFKAEGDVNAKAADGSAKAKAAKESFIAKLYIRTKE